MRLDRLITLYFIQTLRRLHGCGDKLRVPILMYHSVSDRDESNRHPYFETNTRPEVFARQMQFLADNNYTVISLADAVSLLSIVPNPESGSPTPESRREAPTVAQSTSQPVAPRKVCALTWDDGYRDFRDNAWPVLKKHGFTATMFLPTGFIGDERNALNGKDCLTWGEVKELAEEGVSFGAHTVSHMQLYEIYSNSLSCPRKQEATQTDLSFLRMQESMGQHTTIEHELQASKQAIEDHLGSEVPHYSYAYAFPEQDGAFVKSYEAMLRAAGYRAAVSTRIGTATGGDNLFTLRRLPVNSHDDVTLLRAKLKGAYDWIAGPQALWKTLKQGVA